LQRARRQQLAWGQRTPPEGARAGCAGLARWLTGHAAWRPADRGRARRDISPRIATLPTDLFRNQLFLHRSPPTESVITEIVDEVFLPSSAIVIAGTNRGHRHQSGSPPPIGYVSTDHDRRRHQPDKFAYDQLSGVIPDDRSGSSN